tara:strand:- start:129 stop:365 length:237 start_codon:yes stop_codon:yes gene_type:complete
VEKSLLENRIENSTVSDNDINRHHIIGFISSLIIQVSLLYNLSIPGIQTKPIGNYIPSEEEIVVDKKPRSVPGLLGRK